MDNKQIEQIKSNSYSTVKIRNVILTDCVDKNLVDISFYIEEEIGKNFIYNSNKKNKIKLKVFASSGEIKFSDYDSVINSKISSADIFPCLEYIGYGVYSINDLIESSSDTTLSLDYKTKFILDGYDKDNLNIAFVIYYDIEGENIQEEYKAILFSNTYNYILKNNGIDVSEGKLKDSTQIKNTLARENFLQSSKNKLLSLNAEEIIEKIQNLSEQKKQSKKTFISPAFFSRSENGDLNFIFSCDLNKIASQNSPYKKGEMSNLNFSSSIESITILRREYEKEIQKIDYLNNKKKLKQKSPDVLISSNDLNGNLLEQEKETCKIKEIKNLFDGVRSFEIVDKEVYKNKNSLYQYGVRIIINDKYFAFITDVREKLQNNLAFLNEYLNTSYNIKYYNPSKQKFNGIFENENKNLIDNIQNTINYFKTALKLIGINKSEEELSFVSSFLEHRSTTREMIIFFISFYNKIIHLMDTKLLKNKKIILEQWLKDFNNKDGIIDTSERPDIGYSYIFKNPNLRGMMEINLDELNSKLSSDCLYYLGNTSNQFKEYAIGPSKISLSKNITYFFTNKISNNYINIVDAAREKMRDIEINIKSHNSGEGILSNDNGINDFLNFDRLFDKQGISTENFFIRKSEKNGVKDIFVNNLIVGNPPSKQQKKYDYTKNANSIKNVFLSILQENISNKSTFNRKKPFLLDNINKNFGDNLEEAFKDLSKKSEFLLMYNTICKISYISTQKQIFREDFLIEKPLKIDNKIPKKIICKLELFQNNDFNQFNQVKLPIFDQYFILNIPEQKSTTKQVDSEKTFMPNSTGPQQINNITNDTTNNSTTNLRKIRLQNAISNNGLNVNRS